MTGQIPKPGVASTDLRRSIHSIRVRNPLDWGKKDRQIAPFTAFPAI